LNAIQNQLTETTVKSPRSKSEKQLQDEQILQALEEVAEKLSVHVHYEEMKAFEFRVKDGFCEWKGESHIYIDRKRPLKEKINILSSELKKFDLDDIYIPPLLRERIFGLPNQVDTQTGVIDS